MVYACSLTGTTILSPIFISKTLCLKLNFAIKFPIFVCWYVQRYNKICNIQTKRQQIMKNFLFELRMHYDGNCGAFIISLIVNNLWQNVRLRDFLMLIFLDNYVTRTAKNKRLVTYSRLLSNLYTDSLFREE